MARSPKESNYVASGLPAAACVPPKSGFPLLRREPQHLLQRVALSPDRFHHGESFRSRICGVA